MADAGVEGPQTCPKGLRHGFGIAAVAAGVPLPTIAAALGHANLQTTAIYTTAAGLEARGFLARMWDPKADSAGSGALRPPEKARSSHGAGSCTESWSAMRVTDPHRTPKRTF